MAFAAYEDVPLNDLGSSEDICWIQPMHFVETHEVYHDFCKIHGNPSKTKTFGDYQVHFWRGVQFKKGQPRGELYLVEFPNVSASYFSG